MKARRRRSSPRSAINRCRLVVVSRRAGGLNHAGIAGIAIIPITIALLAVQGALAALIPVFTSMGVSLAKASPSSLHPPPPE